MSLFKVQHADHKPFLTVGMGFQWVNETQKYHDLPKPIDWYEGMTVFTTSVTHQIHCLVSSTSAFSWQYQKPVEAFPTTR